MFGYLSGDMLASPRSIFAFGRDALLPRLFASVHPRFRTPHVAIVTHALLVAAVAATNTFTHLALLSNVGVLLPLLPRLRGGAALRLAPRRRFGARGCGCRASA